MASFEKPNEKLLQVDLGGEKVISRKGAMVGYRGKVTFQRSFLAAGGVRQLAARAVTNEGMALMEAEGEGTVFYADYGRIVTVIDLVGDRLLVEADSVLAFEPTMNVGTEFLGRSGLSGLAAGALSGQGLFTTVFEGKGRIAIVSEGECIELEVNENEPAFVDPQAFVARVGNLRTSFHTDVSWKNLIGQSSGESYQLKFEGAGRVYVQASER